MYPSSISLVGLFQGIIQNIERLKGGNLEPWITGGMWVGGRPNFKGATSDPSSYYALIFEECMFISEKYPIIFHNNHFKFRSAFLFLRNVLLIFRIALLNWFLFIYCRDLFQWIFLCSWLHLLLVLLRAAQIDKMCLALVSFPLGTLYWPTYAFLVILKPLHEVWFFMHFIQNLASMIVWKIRCP